MASPVSPKRISPKPPLEVREHGVDLVTRGLALEFDARADRQAVVQHGLAEEVDLDACLNT